MAHNSNQSREIERKLRAVLERHGSDGRAITVQTLAANAGMPKQPREFAMALQHLLAEGVIELAGQDPIPGSPIAFRLARRSEDSVQFEAMKNLPHGTSPSLSPWRDTGAFENATEPGRLRRTRVISG